VSFAGIGPFCHVRNETSAQNGSYGNNEILWSVVWGVGDVGGVFVRVV